ncbi:hypothetical protein B0H63DRAFT_538290 [Podospora didyma]|uniref:Uncharacterized protein n=1 Tax=Podospora didyma TaxID=330526 RepID=A0AAE0NYS0_9PEZI|nr:hypothetical protein B0H63DRAFT_538290 [Podospora didyma]
MQPRLVAELGELPALNITSLDNVYQQGKTDIIAAMSQICRKLMQDLGVKWKPQPVDEALRRCAIDWIKTELEPEVGTVSKRFLLSTDAGLKFTERCYEEGDFATKASMVKFASLAIYLDDIIDKDGAMASQAGSFLLSIMNRSSRKTTNRPSTHGIWLEVYRKVSVELASHMSDPLASSMILHSCTIFIESSALEFSIQKNQEKYYLVKSGVAEHARDEDERRLARDGGFDIPLPLDSDRLAPDGHLMPHGWPIWLRERTAVAEAFAITFFRPPGGVDLPVWAWVTAISEMRTFLLATNDLLSFSKELMDDDTTSSIAVITKERRLIDIPGSAPDGGWCLRDSVEEVFGKAVAAAARINRILRPTNPKTRYAPGGQSYSVAELVALLKRPPHELSNLNFDHADVMKALALKLWETHQKGYVIWHFACPRYRTYELFDYVRDMMGPESAGAEWLTESFRHVT